MATLLDIFWSTRLGRGGGVICSNDLKGFGYDCCSYLILCEVGRGDYAAMLICCFPMQSWEENESISYSGSVSCCVN